jgi:glycosyltransferase involved in cell wall biosynthesis
MKILIISYDFYPNIGGVAQHVFNLSKSLKIRNHEVHVFTLRYSLKDKFVEDLFGVKVFRFFTFNISKLRGILWLFQVIFFGFFYSIFKRLDVIHTHTVIPDSLAGLFIFSKKKIFTNHSSQFLELYDDKNKNLLKLFYIMILKKFNNIIAPSIELKEKSEKFFNKNSFYIPNGVDIEKFKPISLEEKDKKKKEIFNKLNLEKREYLIFCPRRLEPKNGVEYFVGAIKLVLEKEKKLWAIISGNEYIKEYASKIKNMIKELNLSNYIFFTGPVPHEQIIEFYQASDIVVLPSLMEATSISGLEALACGVPVVGTTVGGIPEIVYDDVNGLLVPPKDYNKLAEALVDLLKNKEKRLNMSLKAREIIINKFSWDKIVEEVEKIYSLS